MQFVDALNVISLFSGTMTINLLNLESSQEFAL